MSDLTHLTIAAAIEGLAAKKFSARELTDAHIIKMRAAKGLNAYITETPELARAKADASDKKSFRSSLSTTTSREIGSTNDGQPVPESNLSFER